MVRRVDRVLTWLVLLVAAAAVVVALIELDQRADEEDVALPPTAIPSPIASLLPTSPGPAAESPATVESPAQTQPLPTATTAGPAATGPVATVAPPPTPSPAPVVPTATPRVGASGVEPMPESGGGAMPAGLVITMLGLALSYLARRAY